MGVSWLVSLQTSPRSGQSGHRGVRPRRDSGHGGPPRPITRSARSATAEIHRAARVACQNSCRASDLGFYPRQSCSFASSICSWSGCSAGWRGAVGSHVHDVVTVVNAGDPALLGCYARNGFTRTTPELTGTAEIRAGARQSRLAAECSVRPESRRGRGAGAPRGQGPACCVPRERRRVHLRSRRRASTRSRPPSTGQRQQLQAVP